MLAARVLLSLACVVGLIWYAGRRLGAPARATKRGGDEHDVRVVGRHGIGRHSGVAVVAIGTRRLLVGYGEQQVTMLSELGPVVPPPEPPPGAEPRKRATAARPAPQLERAKPVKKAHDGIAAAVGAAGKPGEAQGGPLAGSVLAPETWRSLVRTLQDRTVRR
ncbi:Flagellar protein OS=Cellulomonas persica OX=76861 GN=CPE01_31400 PE=4 SV=1 [Cellulomonas persica]